MALENLSGPARAASLEKPERIPGLDALRGLFLVLMTVTHLPTRFSTYSHDAFGFVSAAEGFVFLSAFLVAHIYTPRLRQQGPAPVQKALWRRALFIYGAHLALLYVAFLLASFFSDRPAIYNVLSFFIDEPGRALVAAPLLVYEPPLFDILPLYAVFLALTPLVLEVMVRRGARFVLLPSALLWGLAQLGARAHGHALALAVFGEMPEYVFGAFDLLGWQLLWCLGLFLGVSKGTRASLAGALPRGLLPAAIATCLFFLGLRYAERLWGMSVDAPALLDKWRLAPLRLVNLGAWLIVLAQIGPKFGGALLARALARLGRESLAVFCAHVLLALGAFLLIDDADVGFELWQEFVVVPVGFLLLYGVALHRTAIRKIA
jgi:hypothetical protein